MGTAGGAGGDNGPWQALLVASLSASHTVLASKQHEYHVVPLQYLWLAIPPQWQESPKHIYPQLPTAEADWHAARMLGSAQSARRNVCGGTRTILAAENRCTAAERRVPTITTSVSGFY